MCEAGKKKVIFILPSYRIGGITTSLYSLLSLLDTQRVDASVYAVSDTGDYKGKLPNCREIRAIWSFSRSSDGLSGFSLLLHKSKMLIETFFKHIHIDTVPWFVRLSNSALKFSHFDAVICFDESLASYCCHIPSRNKIEWIHCDYSRHYAISDTNKEREAYNKFDKVVCVSNFAKSTFDAIFSQYQEKSICIHNVINVEDIQSRSKTDVELSPLFDTSRYTIVSAGRLDPIKGFDMIPSIANEIKRLTSKPFNWYIIGGGNQTVWDEVDSAIDKYGVRGEVIMLGQQEYIYSYMVRCDLYVSTSHSESFPMVVNEAKALLKPVVSNNFPSAKESIQNGIDGIICTYSDMAQAIVDMMNSPIRKTRATIDNTESLNLFYSII